MSPSGRQWRLAGHVAAWAAVAAVAVYLRTWSLGAQVVLDDEWHALNKLIAAGYGDILLSFGHADHSIPLTLWYKLLADTVGLTEWGMRLPVLAFGVASVFALPALFASWIGPSERLCAAALLSVSPAVIHFSRFARPYALTGVLCLAAAVWFYLWWRDGGRGRAVGYGASTALAAWLHPVTLAFTLAAPLWAGLRSLVIGARRGDWRPLRRAVAIGLATAAACAVLLGPPLWHDAGALAYKAGAHYPGPGTFLVAWQLMAGSGYLAAALAILGLSTYGLWRLARRDRTFAGYLGVLVLASLALVALSGAMWLHQGVVLMRYMLPMLPITLIGMAVALVALTDRFLAGRSGAWAFRAAGLGAVMLALYQLGPLPEQYSGTNQFTAHMYYQFDYDTERSDYRRALAGIEVPDFYRRISDAGSGWKVVEAPWRLESHYNPIPFYQHVHGLPVKIGFLDGLCAEGLYGEYPVDAAGLEFRHFVHLADLLDDPPPRTFLVIHREPAQEGWRKLPSVEPCIQAFRDRYEPWAETGRAVVFRFDGPK